MTKQRKLGPEDCPSHTPVRKSQHGLCLPTASPASSQLSSHRPCWPPISSRWRVTPSGAPTRRGRACSHLGGLPYRFHPSWVSGTQGTLQAWPPRPAGPFSWIAHYDLPFPEPGRRSDPHRGDGFHTGLHRGWVLRPGVLSPTLVEPRVAQETDESDISLPTHFAHLWFHTVTQR